MYYVCIWLKNYCIKKPYAYDANMRIYAITSRFHGFPPQKKQKWSELKGVMLWLVEVGPPKSPKLVVPTSICLEILWTGLGRKPIQNPRNKWCVDKFAYAICTTQPNHSPKSTDSNLFPSLSISFPFPAVSCPQIKLILPSPPSDTSRTKILANDLPDQSSWGLFSVTQRQRLFVGFCLKTHTVLFQHDDSDDRWMIANFSATNNALRNRKSSRLFGWHPWWIPSKESPGWAVDGGVVTPFHVGSVHGFSKLIDFMQKL